MASNEKYTVLYGRLSQEDTQKTNKTDDSNSIQNQKLLLEKYAAEKGFTNTLFLYDDGYSGTNFNRPGWQQVMELMENGQVETLIVKDMSRLGREYLQVGQYTELIFPSYGVRFIAVNDGVDSLYESTNDFTPFRNLMNEFYAKDCSKKGRSVVRLKAETGARVSSRPRYGYMKDPADPKRHMVPDPETAPVVRYIFDLCVSGKGPAQIAKQLKKDKIPTPGYSYYQKHGVELTGVDITQPYNWSTNTVAGILEDETYLGHTINLKSTTLSFKNKKRIERPESEQLRFENTHEALVTQQTWEIVQDIRKHKRRRANMAEQNIFSGLVYCLDCGGTMVLHRAHTMDAVKNNFMCSTYKKKGKDICSAHYIREQELNAILLDDIRRVTHFARQNELRFAEHIRKKQGKEAQQEIAMLCPLHGPIWRKDLGWFLDKYEKWSTYTPEERTAAIFCGSVYGHTENAADLLANRLAQQGVQNIALYDVSHTDVSLLVSEAFRCSHLVFAASTYNNGIFTPMENLLLDLKAHNLQNRTVALIENADGRNCFLHEKHDAAGRDRQRQILCEGGAVRGVESSSRRAGG